MYSLQYLHCFHLNVNCFHWLPPLGYISRCDLIHIVVLCHFAVGIKSLLRDISRFSLRQPCNRRLLHCKADKTVRQTETASSFT